MILSGGWEQYKRLSEAPETKDPDDDADDYQLDDADAEPPQDEGDSPSGDDGGDADEGSKPDQDGGDDTPDYTDLDGADGESDPDSGQTDDETDPTVDDSEDEAGDADSLKKMILLSQFRELAKVLDSLALSADNLDREDEFDGDDNFDYLQDKIAELKQKLNFVLAEKFLKSGYAELLKLFYYFKYSLNDLAEMAEKLVAAGGKR